MTLFILALNTSYKILSNILKYLHLLIDIQNVVYDLWTWYVAWVAPGSNNSEKGFGNELFMRCWQDELRCKFGISEHGLVEFYCRIKDWQGERSMSISTMKHSFFSKEAIIAKPGFNRWLVPPAALCVHLCIGQVYAFSVFNKPLTQVIGITGSAPSDWKLTWKHGKPRRSRRWWIVRTTKLFFVNLDDSVNFEYGHLH